MRRIATQSEGRAAEASLSLPGAAAADGPLEVSASALPESDAWLSVPGGQG